MPSRRPHTKSRAGCKRCKEKHIKCDEAQPVCGACARYNVPCVPKPSRSRAKPASSAQSQPSVSPGPIQGAESRSSITVWEFGLLHHWILHVADSFNVSRGFCDAWRNHAIKDAVQHDFFLHMILMLSCLHLALTKSPSFTEAHRAFILEGCSVATARFRIEAGNINDSNCQVVRGFPFLLSIYGFALGQLDCEDKSDEAVLDEMIHILILIKGNSLIRDTTNPWMQLRGLEAWMDEKDVFTNDPNELQSDLDLVRAVGDLERWIDSSDDDLAVKASNTNTVNLFKGALDFHLKLNLRPLAWPNVIQNDYLDLLRQRNPMAMVILAHYAVILGQCSSQWWCSNWGVQLVSVIASLLPEKYTGAMAYPRRMLNLNPDRQ
ncbi:hypothetical protein ASPVEDRAFT_55746 [Aspergillus versicolor CBS 583.65]|uniref:Zn(2)-C6 fungal-type domain-containing protein n=1 Tax=Aspergillus versicolor CBS 583.65 TaxID=1036611 RepID=A0A1L9PWT0_ASPVE|nr:uncharacterized protein ASPVEDRAFT_55746 [Aspergillus versicolor CBS 583.65]OJJ06001.1 hypothetical protein ASPVEDRAFT_55746 [Aspergillus versicolor CBS 583.65]